jgi:hypothetical protein
LTYFVSFGQFSCFVHLHSNFHLTRHSDRLSAYGICGGQSFIRTFGFISQSILDTYLRPSLRCATFLTNQHDIITWFHRLI